MSIEVIWDNPQQTIVRFVYTDKWDWQTFREVVILGNEMMDTVAHPVISIVDMSSTFFIPPGSITHIRWAVEYSGNHNNSRKVVFVRASTLYQMIISALKQAYPNVDVAASFYYVDDLDAGRELAQQLRLELIQADSNR